MSKKAPPSKTARRSRGAIHSVQLAGERTRRCLSRPDHRKSKGKKPPKGFEEGWFARDLRRRVEKALEKYPFAQGIERIVMPACSPAKRCNSGLCPRCIRQFRLRIVSFARAQRLHHQQWKFVTIRPDDYTVAPGDNHPFGKLKDRPEILRLIQILRRAYIAQSKKLTPLPPFFSIGSIETVYNLVGNRPTGKPFHLHFLVSATLSDDVIEKAAERCFRIAGAAKWQSPDAVFIDLVKPGWENFARVLTYCVKQPFRRKSRRDAADRFGMQQKLKSNELAELANNLGPHGCTGRVILAGLRYEGGKFRMLGVKSTSNNKVREGTDNHSNGASAVRRGDV